MQFNHGRTKIVKWLDGQVYLDEPEMWGSGTPMGTPRKRRNWFQWRIRWKQLPFFSFEKKDKKTDAIGSSVWMTYVDRLNSSQIVFRAGFVQEWQSNLLCVKTDYMLTVFIISFRTCTPIENRPFPERRTSKHRLITVGMKGNLRSWLVSKNKLRLCNESSFFERRSGFHCFPRNNTSRCLVWHADEEIWSSTSSSSMGPLIWWLSAEIRDFSFP